MDPKASPGQRRYNLGVRILSTAVLPWASLSNSHWRSLLTETRRTLEDIRGLVVYVPQDLRFSTLFCFVLNHLFHRLLVFTLHYTNAVGIRTRWIMLVQEPEGSLLFWLGQTWKKTKPIFVLVLFIDVALKKKIFACDLSTVRRHPCSGSYSGTMIPSNSRSQNGWEREESRCCDGPDLSLTDMLCSESCAQTNTANLNELMQHCEEEWARIPPQWHERLINHTENDYFSLLLVKVVLLHHQSKLVFTGLVEG